MTTYLSSEEIDKLPKVCPSIFFDLDSSGMSPLHYAASNCNQMVLEIFGLMEKCDFDFPNENGDTCLHLAVSNSKCTPELVTYLLSKGCNVDKLNNKNKKPMDLTTNNDIISLLENSVKTLSKVRIDESTQNKKKTNKD